jgi:iron complex outermembrane recepter protein
MRRGTAKNERLAQCPRLECIASGNNTMKRSNSYQSASVAALAAALCLSINTQAQADGVSSAPSTAVATSADTVAEPELEVVVVTATKRETNLQTTPISMSVMGANTLAERKVQSLLDLADGGIPSLRVATFEARQSALTIGIRGIVPLDANQPAREQGVGVYIDGVYLGRQHGLNAGLFDIERVEVLKGPQGTLFGRNTEGGALSIVSKAPSGEYGGRINVGVGNIGSSNVSLHVDLPEWNNVSLKLDGVIQNQDAITKNPLQGQAGFGLFNRAGFRIAARWKPVDGITNDLSYDFARDNNTPFYSQLLNFNPNNCSSGGTNVAPLAIPAGSNCVTPGTAFRGSQGTVRALMPGVVVNGSSLMRTADIGVPHTESSDETFGITNVFKWKISSALELRSITAWRGVDVEQYDNSGGAHRVPIVNLTAACTAAAPCPFSRYSNADLNQRQFSQEFQAVGTVGNFYYVAGLYYFKEDVSDDAATPNSMGAIAVLTGTAVTGATFVPIPFCTATPNPSLGKAVSGCSIDRASSVKSQSYAVYGQVTWDVTDALHITAGGRYTTDQKEGRLLFSRNLNYDDPANAAAVARNGYAPLDKEWSRFNPLLTIAYDLGENVHAYAKYATGYRAGGASSRTSNYQSFNPEDVKSYEIGLKADFWDRRARINIAAYMMDRKNSQVDLSTIQPTATGNFNNLVTFNAPGVTKINGVEADLTVKPMEGLTIGVSYAYTYFDVPLVPVTYREFTAAGVPTGNATTVDQKFYIVYTPRNAASASIDYEMPFGTGDAKVKFHLDANYSEATQAFDQFATKNDESFVVNGRVSLMGITIGSGGQEMTLGLWSRNLLDTQYVYRRDPSNSLPSVQTTAATGVPNILTVANNGNILGDYGNFNMPRTFGIDATLKF